MTVDQGDAGQVVSVEFSIRDGDVWNKDDMVFRAKKQTLDTLKYANKTYPDAAEVKINGNRITQDEYGNNAESQLFSVVYDRDTIDRINFRTVDSDTIWDIRDGGSVSPWLFIPE